MTSQRVVPYDLEVEKAVLGCCFLDPIRSMPQCIEKSVAEKFYDLRHRKVFEAMEQLSQAGNPIDQITVWNLMKSNPGTVDMGYVSTLPDAASSAANLEYYLDRMIQHHYARTVIRVAQELADAAYTQGENMEELVQLAETKITALSRQAPTKVEKTRREDLLEIIEEIEQASLGGIVNTGIPTGFSGIDKAIGGLEPGRTIVLAARPALGKSSLAMNIADNIAMNQGLAVGVFNLEMTRKQILKRSLGSASRVNMKRVYEPRAATERDISRLVTAMPGVSKAKIYIKSGTSINIASLRSEARRMVSEFGVSAFVIDYLQLVTGSSSRENRTNEVSEVSRQLKAMALELNVPVLIISQLNRESEKDDNRRPRLSDLRESGAIEQDGDIVMMLWCENPESESGGVLPMKLLIPKNRDGSRNEVDLVFMKEYTRFEQAAPASAYNPSI